MGLCNIILSRITSFFGTILITVVLRIGIGLNEGWEKASSFYFLRHEKNEMCLTARWLFSLQVTPNNPTFINHILKIRYDKVTFSLKLSHKCNEIFLQKYIKRI